MEGAEDWEAILSPTHSLPKTGLCSACCCLPFLAVKHLPQAFPTLSQPSAWRNVPARGHGSQSGHPQAGHCHQSSNTAWSPWSLRIYGGNDLLSAKQGSLGPHLPQGDISGMWPWWAERLSPSILVPGLPLDCSSSTSSSNRPQPAVSMSSKGMLVSSVEDTPGRSLHEVFGKGPVTIADGPAIPGQAVAAPSLEGPGWMGHGAI